MKAKSFLLMSTLIAALPLYAHRIYVFAAPENGKITGYVYFQRGDRAKGVEVNIYSSDGVETGSARSGKNGEFSFDIKDKSIGGYKVTASTPDGHKAEYSVSLQPLSDTPGRKEKKKGQENIDESRLCRIISVEMEKKLLPLREDIEKYGNRMALRDIIGGIGFIFGVSGLYFFLSGRRKKR